MSEQHDPTDAQLDRLLRRWAGEEAADSHGEDRLLQAILTAMPHVPQTPDRQPELAWLGISASRDDSSRGAWSVLAVCGVVMVLLAVTLAIPGSPRSASPTVTGPTAVIANGAAMPAELTELWNHTANLFGPQLNWLCDLDGELLLGVAPGSATSAVPDRAYVLLTVRVRDTPSGEWAAIWTGRVVCPLGESVDFDSNSTHSGGTIWVQSRPDGRVVASHWLNWTDHPEISGSVETEVVPGESRVVAERITEGQSIQLVQEDLDTKGLMSRTIVVLPPP